MGELLLIYFGGLSKIKPLTLWHHFFLTLEGGNNSDRARLTCFPCFSFRRVLLAKIIISYFDIDSCNVSDNAALKKLYELCAVCIAKKNVFSIIFLQFFFSLFFSILFSVALGARGAAKIGFG